MLYDKIVYVLYSLIDFGFNGKENKYLWINKFKDKWVEDTTKYGLDKECFLLISAKAVNAPGMDYMS